MKRGVVFSLGTALAVLGVGALGSSCQGGLDDPRDLPPLDEAYYRCRVQPVLTKSCAGLACHGNEQRYFHIYTRNRLRVSTDPATINAQLTEEERGFNFNSARAFIDPEDPESSLLLKKPLEGLKGGYFHVGALIFNKGNIFADEDDKDYKIILAWASGEKEEDPQCIEPGSDQ